MSYREMMNDGKREYRVRRRARLKAIAFLFLPTLVWRRIGCIKE